MATETLEAKATHSATWNIYQDAWADITPVERENLLRQTVEDDCVFADPKSEGQGIKELTQHIEQFQSLYPGASFKTHKFSYHHAQAIAEWMMYDKDGKEFLPGTSVARFNEDGRLTHLAGYFEI